MCAHQTDRNNFSYTLKQTDNNPVFNGVESQPSYFGGVMRLSYLRLYIIFLIDSSNLEIVIFYESYYIISFLAWLHIQFHTSYSIKC